AAQAFFLVVAEPQRYPAMGAEFVHHADTALAVTECDQPLAKKLHVHRRAIRLGNLRRQKRRNPIAPQQISHWRTWVGAREKIVLFAARHGTQDFIGT